MDTLLKEGLRQGLRETFHACYCLHMTTTPNPKEVPTMTTCPDCGGPIAQEAFGVHTDYCRCRRCGHIFTK